MEKSPMDENVYEIYTDGAHKSRRASWAFVVVIQPLDLAVHEAYGLVEDPFAVFKLWSVAGELEAATQAIKWALETDTKIASLISDYEGIQGWAEDWNTNNAWTIKYAKLIKENRNHILELKHVKAHSDNKWNEYVDRLASEQLLKGN